jgi:hypothetical protein
MTTTDQAHSSLTASLQALQELSWDLPTLLFTEPPETEKPFAKISGTTPKWIGQLRLRMLVYTAISIFS